MPTTDTAQRDYTSAETQAYERYISAVAEHNIVCARPDATTKEKMDAAFATDAAFRDFCRIAGLEMGNVRSLADLDLIKAQKSEIGQLTESIRTASAMLAGVHALDAFTIRSQGTPSTDFNAATVLLNDAGTVLTIALKAADGI